MSRGSGSCSSFGLPPNRHLAGEDPFVASRVSTDEARFSVVGAASLNGLFLGLEKDGRSFKELSTPYGA